MAGGVGGALGFDEFQDNAFGAATDLFDKPGSSSLKAIHSGISGLGMGVLRSICEGVIGLAQLAKMGALEYAYDMAGGEQGLAFMEGIAKDLGTDSVKGFSPYDMLRDNHQQVAQLQTSISDGATGFFAAPGEELSAGWDSLVAGAGNYADNVTTMFNSDQNSEIFFSGAEVGKTTTDVVGTVTGTYAVVKGGLGLLPSLPKTSSLEVLFRQKQYLP